MKRIFLFCLTAFLCLNTFSSPKYLIETGEDGDATWTASIAGAEKVNLKTAEKTLNEWMNATFTSAPSGTDIWLAAGTYALNGSISVSFSTIHLYGGFRGNETAVNLRAAGAEPWNIQYQTIIDGGGTYQICSANFNGIWDGLTFTHGNKSSGNGSVASLYHSAIIRNCRFVNNTSSNQGGVLHIYQKNNVNISNCYFESNTASQGGAIYIANNDKDYTCVINHCYFKDNNASSSANAGGAVYIQGPGTYTIAASVFDHNNASGNGPAIFSNGTGDGVYTTISNCLIKNQQNADRHAVYLLQGAVLNCTFARNAGGALYMSSGSSATYDGRFENNIVWGVDSAECKIAIKDDAHYKFNNNAVVWMILWPNPANAESNMNKYLTIGNTSYFRGPSIGDYHLCAGAEDKVWKQGKDLSGDGITTDLDGATRTTNDIGCYIYKIAPDGCSNCFYLCGE